MKIVTVYVEDTVAVSWGVDEPSETQLGDESWQQVAGPADRERGFLEITTPAEDVVDDA